MNESQAFVCAGNVVEPPLVVPNGEAVSWADSADVIVIGLGAAGSSTVLQACEEGLSVLALDRFDGGGATALSGGVVYAGGGTTIQKEAGVTDSVDEMYKYLELEAGDAARPETLRRFCVESAADIDWLIGHGVPFKGSLTKEKVTLPPEGKFLYYSGNERVPAMAEKAKPAARGHRTVGKGWTGKYLGAALLKAVRSSSACIRPHSRAMRMIRDVDGQVLGVEILEIPESSWAAHRALYNKVAPLRPFNGKRAEKAIAECRVLEAKVGVRRNIRATRGLVLSTGGFIYNLDMVRDINKPVADNYEALMRTGSMGCDGSGIQLGMSIGGATRKMRNIFLGRTLSPPEAQVRGLLVNRLGKRFVNEDGYLSTIASAIMEQPDGKAWLVLDAAHFRKALRQCTPSHDAFMTLRLPALLNIMFGGTKRGRTLEALAHKLGADAAGLRQTLRESNESITAGRPDPGGKNDDYREILNEDGPFYAINVAISNLYSFTMSFTLGGLLVDEESGAVLNADGQPVAGLYAAGRAAAGLCVNGYQSGMSLSDCVFSGRRAARAIAARQNASTRTVIAG